MAFHSLPCVVESVTTTDLIFHQRMKNTYDNYCSSKNLQEVFHPDNDILDYMSGYKIICGRSWTSVDHVLMPIHTEISGWGHWILGRFSVKERVLFIYNSIRSPQIDAEIIKDVECYSVLLPTFLYLLGLHYKRKELFTGDGKSRASTETPLSCGCPTLSAATVPKRTTTNGGPKSQFRRQSTGDGRR
ncbi:Unknown protein [Striga hermonthica]|uniref:Ubiquitin-like protease family profile domain-containing protein n=1 Tax=Striga hermonthica TaxID=68872 RepID=A0A9N7NSE0_STRHE|nr:Unknown protein [Striga hermonthica]